MITTTPKEKSVNQKKGRVKRSESLIIRRRKTMKKRTIYSWGAATVIFLVLMIVTPTIPQSQAYHDFADQRTFFGNFSSFSHHLLGFYLTIRQSQGSRMLSTSSPTSLSSSSASSVSSSAFTQMITSDSGE